MENHGDINYERIAEAIDFIQTNFRDQPSLAEVAASVHLSPFHFQRLFTTWAGTSPKKFLQYISIEYAKRLLSESHATLFEAAYETGLSGTGRLHDLFVSIEGMTPAEYKYGGRMLNINYGFFHSPFGRVLTASTVKGICHMAFADDEAKALEFLESRFPQATYQHRQDAFQRNALLIFAHDWRNLDTIRLHLKGTAFQLKVWETLLRIPAGRLATYGRVAQQIGNAGASRAVGSAVGDNPVAYLIPCHRIIRSTGVIGGYMWGNLRKTAMIGWELARDHGKE